MELPNLNPFKDKILLTGILLILVSFGIFMLPEFDGIQLYENSDFGIFFFNYGLSIAYLVVLTINGIIKFKWKVFKDSMDYLLLLLVLFLISAFSLNREINVFEKSADWMCVYLTVQSLSLILLCFRRNLPAIINYILFFFLGTGMVLYIYYAVYLVPLYIISTIGAIFFGLSLHVFVPLLFFTVILRFVIRSARENNRLLFPFITGIVIPVGFVICFLFQWYHVKKEVNYVLNESIANDSDLPPWAMLSQQIPRSMFFEKMIKAGLVYSTPDENGFWGWRMPQITFDEQKKHDPLVMIAALFLDKPDLGDKEKIKLLESMYDSRHQALERLWSGDKLETVNVISNIKIFPEYRLAYTEKILSIRNKGNKQRWRNQQEAIYTFHLPEGGVVTSLSLWINGKEEKGILTTKNKADSAYKTIVGVEQRDPSVVHWQEGNRVSVRIFPCTPVENRRFKIGVTTPLNLKDKKLVYENIYFDGPSGVSATESIQLLFSQSPANMELPFEFTKPSDKIYKANKTYEPYWEIKCDDMKLSTEKFSFDNRSFSIDDYHPKFVNFSPEKIYLDLNTSWTFEEYSDLLMNLKNLDVFVFTDEWTKINDQNKTKIFKEATKLNFSLFPFHKMSNSSGALVITKSTTTSPDLGDLSDCNFAESLKRFLKEPKDIRIYNIGSNLSPYLKTIKDLHLLIYEQGSVTELADQLKKHEFVQSQENDSSVVIDQAGIIIRESNDSVYGKAPDHLQRLFSYGRIMKQTGNNYFNHDFITDDNISEAKASYIVSPVSSLIVLETKQDYERFGIEENKNSLKNASMKSSGSVPEPHEWMLIILACTMILYLTYKSHLENNKIIR